nr:transposase [Aureimonas sp. AU40]
MHAGADGHERPLGFVLTGGEVSDYKAVPVLLVLPVGKPRLMPADKGYEGDEVRQSLLLKGVLPMIPSKANRRAPAACDFKQYRNRNRIERMFNRLKQARRIATRYDQTASSILAFLSPAPSRMWLRDYATGPGEKLPFRKQPDHGTKATWLLSPKGSIFVQVNRHGDAGPDRASRHSRAGARMRCHGEPQDGDGSRPPPTSPVDLGAA